MGTICVDDKDFRTSGRGTISPASVRLLFRGALTWIIERERKRLSRVALSELTEEQLVDIGISAADARREARRPYWR